MSIRFSVGDQVEVGRDAAIVDEPGLFGDDYSGFIGARGVVAARPSSVPIGGRAGWTEPAHDDIYLVAFTYVGGSTYESAVPERVLRRLS